LVQFLFFFVLFMLIYDNEYETKENKN